MEQQVKILAVDDRYENLLALNSILASSNYDVISLQSGEEVLRYLLKEPADHIAVILMDVQMPGLSGFETAELIKQRKACQDIPIIFLTALSTSIEHVLKGYHVGSIDYLFKPIHPKMLRMKVDGFVNIHLNHQKIKYQSELLHKRTLDLEETNRKLAEAEEKLKQQNFLLEQWVEERTSELVDAHEKLIKSQEHFKKMFMLSPSLMAIRRLSDLTYLEINESWKQYTGYGDEIIGTTLDLLSAEAGDSMNFSDVIHNCKVKYETKSKEIRTALLSTEIIDIENESCLLEVAVDITESLRFESEMARLAQLNLVGEMAAGIAHEIRNPMTTIRGFLQLFRENDRHMQKEYIPIMLEELDRANEIITEYLSLAKNKQSHQQPENINRIIEMLLPLIQAEAVMSGKHVHFQLKDCPVIQLDDKEMRQLILNMCMNGLEAMSLGGKLRIETYTEAEHVVLLIADEGIGINEEHLEKLGRPFFTTKDEGTGLGLAICYSIAARHQASIEVQSSEKGTTFLIRFPIPAARIQG
ncbi:response regulator [Paenibacillus frigoriresistens]|uniref:ATP-binding protein n=1 Tax=Paenibacillus alginolyticus TaxID=59839 RepID=UPI001565592B|nr:ATP-binding protein [Paenibacillus frigoriresistens]NRF90669.1 response regulator [Paenibacillus frigoriresistens]